MSPEVVEGLLSSDYDEWLAEADSIKEFFAKFGDRLPPQLNDELEALKKRLKG
ncbi:MAG: phosphoenolpyruvate carboxykinase domain-containing protein [Planctomycetota bacterium]|jgi:phosphoenolpyruvate carboxykinase (GTP)